MNYAVYQSYNIFYGLDTSATTTYQDAEEWNTRTLVYLMLAMNLYGNEYVAYLLHAMV